MNLKLLNKAIKDTNGNEFKILYYILNKKSLGVSEFHKEVVVKELNITPRKFGLITDSLVKKGYVTKKTNSKGDIYYFDIHYSTSPCKSSKTTTAKEQYHQQLEHPLWLKKRLVILERDGYKCRLCGSSSNLQVHHIKYSNGKNAWEYPNLDLITLCKECHSKVHSDLKHELNPYNTK